MKTVLNVATMALVLMICAPPWVTAQSYTVATQVFSGGGTNASNGNYSLQGTFRQTAIGAERTLDQTSQLQNGYWSWIRSLGPCCIGMRGNVDGDIYEIVELADLTFLVDYVFYGSPVPYCITEADVDGSGGVDIGDVTYLADYLFDPNSPAPAACP